MKKSLLFSSIVMIALLCFSASAEMICEFDFMIDRQTEDDVLNGQTFVIGSTPGDYDTSLYNSASTNQAEVNQTAAPVYREYDDGDVEFLDPDGFALDANAGLLHYWNTEESTLKTLTHQSRPVSVWGRFRCDNLSAAEGSVGYMMRNAFGHPAGGPGANYACGIISNGNVGCIFSCNVNADDPSTFVFDTGVPCVEGEWYDLGFSYETADNTVKIYLGGQLQGTRVVNPIGVGDWLHFGGYPAGWAAYEGLVDKVIIWDTVEPDNTFFALSIPEPSLVCTLLAAGIFLLRRK